MSLVKIDPYVSQIRDAVYGEEVRDAIINALLAMNDEIAYGTRGGSGLPVSIKVLGIGNSYIRDGFRWLWKILKEAGIKYVTVGHGYIGGITLSNMYRAANGTNPEQAANTFEYWKYDDSYTPTKTQGYTLQSIFEDESWDIAVFQQQSDLAGVLASYTDSGDDHWNINMFITMLKQHVDSEKLKIGIMMPWSHAAGYNASNSYETYHNSNPTTQLSHNRTVIPKVAKYMSQCDFVINCGEAVAAARQNQYLGAIGTEMLKSDKNHLKFGIPQFMVSFCCAATMLGITPDQINWYPTSNNEADIDDTETSSYLAYLAKQYAYNASRLIL